MANILITGASGFVGKHLVRNVLRSNNTPIALVKEHNRKVDQELFKQVEQKGAVIYGSITDKNLLREVVNKYELDYIVHLAALPIVSICDSNPWSAYEVNTMGTVALYEAVRDELHRNKRLKKIIHFSTDKSYSSSSPPGGYTEETPFGVADTYCTSKACGDLIAQSYAKTYNLPICIVRCGNLYGSRDLNLSRLIPGSILRLLNNEQPVLYTDAAKMKREFIHVSDAVAACNTLFKEGIRGEVYNIGTGKMYEIIDVINMIRDKINPQLEIKMVDRNLFELNEQCLNSVKLQRLGWKCQVSLSAGLDEAIPWYKEWREKVDFSK